MQFTTPKVFLIAETKINQEGMQAYLKAIGAEGWTTNAPTDGEYLIEAAGKRCYNSYSTDLNANLTRVRENDNERYIGEGLLDVKHGSVLEHVNVTWSLVDVSRILTHELVRHRIAGFSQESLRFVRLTALRMYYPTVFTESVLREIAEYLMSKGKDLYLGQVGYADPGLLADYLQSRFQQVAEQLEGVQKEFADILRLDDLGEFKIKKKLTSAMRRLAPEGLGTGIIMTGNLRTWRHVIEQRTQEGAEEEIRLAFNYIGDDMMNRYPNAFQDVTVKDTGDGLSEYRFRNSKV